MKRFIYSLLFITIVLFPIATYAATVESGQNITISESKKDLYLFGSTVNINSDTLGDVVGFAGNFNINNKIAESAIVISGTADVRESIGRHLRVLSGDVALSNTVGGDAVILGSTLNTTKTSRVLGDLIFLGGQSNLSGTVSGKTQIASGSANVSGQYGGDFIFNGNTLEISDSTVITGKLTYYSPSEAIISPSAKVTGGVEYHKTESQKSGFAALITKSGILLVIQSLIAIAAFSLILFLLMKPLINKTMLFASSKALQGGLYGFSAIIIVPIVSLIFCFSIIGAMIGMTLFSMFFAIMLISYGLSAIYLGTLFFNIFKKNDNQNNTVLVCLVGSIFIVILGFVPFIGQWIKFIIFLISAGSFLITAKDTLSTKEIFGGTNAKQSK